MELKFDSNLNYQTDAVKSVTDLFAGQSVSASYFALSGQTSFDHYYFDKENNQYFKNEKVFGQGIGNRLTISKQNILENLRKVQILHKLPLSLSLENLDFCIEMETGTGKTYVYLKTIFELNKLYGFTKFIIVVPSVAIKEGVYKTLQITKEHFNELYEGVVYDYFVYDSSKLEQVRNFAESSSIEIMIINIDAFNKSFTNPDEEKKANIIHREQEQLNDYKPIDLIGETQPIVIIDEPQSVISRDGKGEKPINSLRPLFTLRYSATHREIKNLIYKLDAVDAYEMDLVKSIEVASIQSENYHNEAYIKFKDAYNNGNGVRAKLEIDANVNGTIRKKTVTVKLGEELSSRRFANRDIYEDFCVENIGCDEGNEFIKFFPSGKILEKGESIGDIDNMEIKEAQIERTIREHFDKELQLNKKGIKVLSLFFIDKVSKYRLYNEEDGSLDKGPYAKIFEKKFREVFESDPKYKELYSDEDLEDIGKFHNGYFSEDNNHKLKEYTRKSNGEYRLTKADESTFNLIMRKKEELLSFDNDLKFIFSHSALREGWDNPNVFQICTLNPTHEEIKKRQEIGRGLRLCVNQDGERIHDKSVNILTIMANESYDSFARSLQTEIEDDTHIKFGILTETSFSYLTIKNDAGEYEILGDQSSEIIFNYFKEMNYINDDGKVQEALKVAILNDNVSVPDGFESIKDQITHLVSNYTKKINIKNADKKQKVEVRDHILDDSNFKELWDKIKYKTTYLVDFNDDELIDRCSQALNEQIEVHFPKLVYTKAGLSIDASGVHVNEEGIIPPTPIFPKVQQVALPDIVKILQKETDLTRSCIVDILIKSDTLGKFKKNPYEYIEEALKIINREMKHLLLNKIRYIPLDEFYSEKLFTEDISTGYLEKNLFKVEHSIYKYVIYDSEVEHEFAKNLDKDPDVLLYTKLPTGFKIKTPLGFYRPDWAILLKGKEENKLYFVIETKGNIDPYTLRPTEKGKIDCGYKHFEALDRGVRFKEVDNYHNFKTRIK